MSEPITPNDPHANAPDEDPEQHLGPEVADPWDLPDPEPDWQTVY